MNNADRQRGFTFVELMLVIIILVMMTAFTGVYYASAHKKTSLTAAARNLLLTGKYARMCAIEQGQTCQLYLDGSRRQFYVLAWVRDPVSREKKQMVVSNAYCRKTALETGIGFEYVDIKPAGGDDEIVLGDNDRIHFYPDGSCDAAVIQVGNGRHSMTAVFSPAYAKIKIYEGSAETVEDEMQAIDLDAMD